MSPVTSRKKPWAILLLCVAGCSRGGGGSGASPVPAGVGSLPPPTGISAVPGDARVTLSWGAVAGASSYSLYWLNVPGVTKGAGAPIPQVQSPFIHLGLQNGTAYYYVLTSVAPDGSESAESQEVQATPAPSGVAPLPPGGLAASAGDGQVTLSWSAVSGADSYNLYWSTSPGVTQTTGTRVAAVASPFDHVGLTNGTTYSYVVTAVNVFGESADSSEASATPQAPPPPAVYGDYDPEDDRIVPLGSRSPGTSSVQLVGNDYVFRFTGGETIDYRIDRTDPDFSQGILRITETTTGALLMRGGQSFQYNGGGGTRLPPQVPSNVVVSLLAEGLQNGTLLLDYRHVYQGVTHGVRYLIGIEGKSLWIRSFSLTPQNLLFANNYHGFHLDRQGGMTGSKFVTIPYMEQVAITYFGGNWFFSEFADLLHSRGAKRALVASAEGSSSPQNFNYVTYNRLTDGAISHPVDDLVWVTVSSAVEDCFVDVDRYPSSPHRVSANRTAVVRQGGSAGFSSAEAQRRKLYNVGFFNSEQYLWDWQYYNSTPLNDPTLYPPGPLLGTYAQFNSLIDTMTALGTPIGLYLTVELMDTGYNSSCIYFNGEGGGNPNFTSTYSIKNGQGGFVPGWDTSVPVNKLCQAQIGKPTQLTDLNHQFFFLLRESKLMQEHFSRHTLSYIDARHRTPWMDQEGGTDKIHNFRDGFLGTKMFFRIQKAMSGGPLLGEWTPFASQRGELEFTGYSDGVRRRLAPPNGVAEKDWYILPDYELKVIRPRTLHHGMGVEAQYAGYPLTQARQDTVRCAEICYGHGIYMHTNGDVPNDFLQDPDELRAYYQITVELQPMFATAASVQVDYWSQGNWVGLKKAIQDGVDFAEPQLRIQYDNGLTILANLSPTPWSNAVLGIPFTFEQDSWVAYNALTGYVNFSAQPAGYGHRFDYVSAPGQFEMIDGRGQSTSFGTISARDLKLVFANGFTVEENGAWPDDFAVTGSLPPFLPPDPPDPLPTPPPNDAGKNFRGLQGMFGWIYRAYDPGVSPPNPGHPYWQKFWVDLEKYHRYPDLDFDAATSFYYYRANPNAFLGATTWHPAAAVDVVRGWCAFAPGTITVMGTAAMLPGGQGGGNGVEVRIRAEFEGPVLWQAQIQAGDVVGTSHSLQLQVKAGDLLLFEVASLGNAQGDTVSWAPEVEY